MKTGASMRCLRKTKKRHKSANKRYLVKISTYNSVHRKNHSGEASYNQSAEEQMMEVDRMSSTAMNHM